MSFTSKVHEKIRVIHNDIDEDMNDINESNTIYKYIDDELTYEEYEEE